MFSTLISATDLNTHLQDENVVLIDCRFDLSAPEMGQVSYEQSHIPRAVYAHLDDHLSSEPHTDEGRHPLPSAEQLQTRFSNFGIDSSKQVIVYDNKGGVYASRLWWMLHYMGHEAVAVLDGGWEAWQSSGLSTETGVNTNSPAEFTGEPNPDMLVVFDQIGGQALLVDSRDAGRYAGEYEPIDARAGHIEGALNRFFGNNWREGTRMMRDAESLRAEFDALLGDVSAENTTFYCGSGVSANVNILAMRYAGLPMPKLYVGSWSEYSRKA